MFFDLSLLKKFVFSTGRLMVQNNSVFSQDDLFQELYMWGCEHDELSGKTNAYITFAMKRQTRFLISTHGWRAVFVPHHNVRGFFSGKGFVSAAAKEIFSNGGVVEDIAIMDADLESKLHSYQQYQQDSDADEGFKCLDLLKPETRDLLIKKYIIGMTRKEIASETNKSEIKIDNEIMKAKRLIRQGKAEDDGLCRKKLHQMVPENIVGRKKPRCKACYANWKDKRVSGDSGGVGR